MNMMTPLTAIDPVLTRTEVAGLVALAARTVPPMWPLESAIAVNPLAGFEELPFAEAVSRAAERFGARRSLPLAAWRAIMAAGRVDEAALRDAAIRHLGGLERAFALIGPDVSRLDLLMARLRDLPVDDLSGAMAPAPVVPGADVAFVAKWCAAFFEQGRAASPMPHRDLGFYRATLAAIGHDPDFRALAGREGQRLLLTVPRDPLEAIAEGLVDLGVPQGAEEARLAGYVALLPGWAGHIRWRSDHADADVAAGAPATMADLVALWVLLDRCGAIATPAELPAPREVTPLLAAHFGFDPYAQALGATGLAAFTAIARMSEDDLAALFMEAAEASWRDAIMPKLQLGAMTASETSVPDAQAVFCIDVRSEPFRRALEAEGKFETLGYAGFFGLPIAVHRFGAERRERMLPVLLSPQHDVAEAAVPGREREAERIAAADKAGRHAARLFEAGKQGGATAFATAEATGPFAGLLMAARTLAPGLVERLGGAMAPDRAEALAPTLAHRHDGTCRPVFSTEEAVGFALSLFRLTGLATPTARIVALLGHGGSAVNNPYAAALDCGACGGHAGGANARLLTAMLNDPAVREGLAAQGVEVPATTVFVAGEHDTTTDKVTIFDRAAVPASHAGDLARLEAAFGRAGAANRTRRAALLGRTADDLLKGAAHWGEVRPEWGLAGNAAFLVGPRSMSRAVDLEGRCFLHSYDWTSDPDGTALATILTAPMVVAQWINCQYLFSTVDNARYGSGDKVTQNVVGGIGVMQGNGGDLAVGLPRQSLFRDDGTPYHVPQRLLTVVLAPFERVEAVVEANDILGRLFGKGWVKLVVIDPRTGKAMRWAEDQELSATAPAVPANDTQEI